MFGWRARIGVLLPPGNPTVEPELYRMVPDGVSLHFARLEAPPSAGPPGGAAGMEERSRAYREGLAGPAAALGQVRPAVVVLAHTASSYALGFGNEQPLIDRIASLGGAPALLAAHAALAALLHFGVKRLALGTPYPESISRQGKAYWEAAGFQVVGYHRLADVADIYAESEERAHLLGRRADAPDAEAVLLSGTGLPTVGMLEPLERDLGKPVISSNQACLWRALRLAGVRDAIPGFGRLLREP
jgi:maleate cis-trans isomerase